MNQTKFLCVLASCLALLSSSGHAATTVSTKGVIAKSGTVFSSSVSEDGADYQIDFQGFHGN